MNDLGPGMAPQEEAAPQEQAPAAQAGSSQAAPEQQAEYDRFVGRAMELIYSEQMFPRIVEMLRGGKKPPGNPDSEPSKKSGPAEALAMTTVTVIERVVGAAKKAGQQLSPDVIFHGGTEIFSQLAEISDKAGISDYANDRDALEAAYFKAIDIYLKQAQRSGDIDKQAAQAQMQKLEEMNKNGELEQMLRDLDAKDQAARQPANDNEAPAEDQEEVGGGMAPKGMA